MTLPVSGPVYLDASGFIYSVEHIEPYRALLEPMWQQTLNRQFTIVRSDLVALETLQTELISEVVEIEKAQVEEMA